MVVVTKDDDSSSNDNKSKLPRSYSNATRPNDSLTTPVDSTSFYTATTASSSSPSSSSILSSASSSSTIKRNPAPPNANSKKFIPKKNQYIEINSEEEEEELKVENISLSQQQQQQYNDNNNNNNLVMNNYLNKKQQDNNNNNNNYIGNINYSNEYFNSNLPSSTSTSTNNNQSNNKNLIQTKPIPLKPLINYETSNSINQPSTVLTTGMNFNPPIGIISNPSLIKISINSTTTTITTTTSVKDFEGTGWIIPKIIKISSSSSSPSNLIEEEREEEGGEGLYDSSLWNLDILDTPSKDLIGEGEDDLSITWEGGIKVQSSKNLNDYRPMGCWMKSSSSSSSSYLPSIPSTSNNQGGDTSVDIKMNDDEDNNDPEEEEDTEMKQSLMNSNHSFRTITREELDLIKPHPNSYFSRTKNSWIIFSDQFPKSTSPYFINDDDDNNNNNNSLEIFRTLRNQLFSPTLLNLSSRPEPVQPYNLDESILVPEWSSTRPSLMKLISTKGKEILYSELDYYPAVIPDGLFKLLLEKRSEPTPNQTKLRAGIDSVYTIWKTLDGLLFKGNNRNLKIAGKTFSRSMPFDEITKMIYLNVLGFEVNDSDTLPGGTLKVPDVDDRTTEGSENRRRLLRCWLEMGIHLEDFKLRNESSSPTVNTRINIKPAALAMAKTLGGDNIPRIPKETISSADAGWQVVPGSNKNKVLDLKTSINSVGEAIPGAKEYHHLGVVPDVTDKVLEMAYEAQSEINQEFIPFYLGYIDTLSKIRSSDSLDLFRQIERSKGRYSSLDLEKAYELLNAKHGYFLTDEHLWESYGSLERDLMLASKPDNFKRKEIKDAMKLVANNRGSEYLKVMLQSIEGDGEEGGEVEKPKMDLKKALKVLGVEEGIEDDMLIMLYDIRIADAVLSTEKASMKEAATIIAQTLCLPKSLKMLEIGSTGNGWEMPYVSPDRPVGLTNIANTCYLNSLLQFFFTVRELREAICDFSVKYDPELGPINGIPEELRVGGRLVTKREIERSQRFVIHLQMLFNQLIHTPNTSVTPETELAYLALVPSKEEDKEAEAKANTTTTELPLAKANYPLDEPITVDTGSDIIIDPVLLDGSLDKPKSPSVLGKRGSGHLDTTAELTLDGMAIDSSDDSSNTSILPSLIASPSSSFTDERERSVKRRGTTPLIGSDDLITRESGDGTMEIGSLMDIEMHPVVSESTSNFTIAPLPPPLPPRPVQSTLEQEVSSYMAFGRQNDVTECADNVLFQIECALSANFGYDEKNNVLNRTFYGKMRQRLEINDPNELEPVRIMEEKFSSLLVDVAEEGRNIYDGLDTVFDDAMVEIEGKQARRTISLDVIPPILQVQLQRVQFDRVENKIFKSNAHLDFPATLAVDRYLEIDPVDSAAVARRDKTAEIKKALEVTRTRYKDLKKFKSSDVSETLRKVFSHLSNQPDLEDVVSSELAEDTINEANLLQAEVAHLEFLMKDQREEIEKIWSRNQYAVYELVSVFIHRGTALSGHYYIYQRDSKKPESWLKYNDSQVTDIPAAEVFQTSGDTNAYFLVYCRKDRLDAINSVRDVQQIIHPGPLVPVPVLLDYPSTILDDDMLGGHASDLLSID